ncbi:Ig-like domain repeat protein [Luteimicrobium subarcticum]|uniref:Ig-like domain repeat protein n=1 Tax=Luteimicrobium subarcticum TaxID=620910 RepID=UPI00147305E2|nr:Ig-like domain repeat protein [Luteimicrobium subarcticum]
MTATLTSTAGALADDAPQPSPHGFTTDVAGVAPDDDAVPYDSPNADQELAPTPGLLAATSSSTVQHLEVVVATPSGVSSTSVKSWLSRANVDSLVSDVSKYWSAQTGGRVTFAVDKFAYLSPGGSCYSDSAITSLWSRSSKQLYGEDWYSNTAGPSSRQHLVVLYPADSGDADGATTCGGLLGLGTYPSSPSLSSGGLTFAVAGGSGGTSSAQYYAARQTLAHELGHNFGLHHAGVAWCSGSHPDGAFSSSSCADLSYFDLFDLMGGGFDTKGVTPLSAPQKARLGVLSSSVAPAVTPITTTKTYSLSAAGATSGLQTVTAVDPSTHERYYVEYRQKSSSVVFPTTPTWPWKLNVTSGGSTIGSVGYDYGVRILRLAPASSAWAEPYEQTIVPINASGSTSTRTAYLPKGQTFTSRSGQLSIKVNSVPVTTATSGTASVTVGFGTPVVPAMSLTRSSSTQAYGHPTTLTTALSSANGYVPSGIVTIRQDGTAVKTIRVSTSGKAVYTVPSSLSLGSHRYTSSFAPDSTAKARNIGAPAYRTTYVTVAKATPTVSVTIAPSTVSRGLHPRATVKVVSPGVSAPTGTLAVYVAGKKVASATLTPARHGGAIITLPAQTKAGKYAVHATFYSTTSTLSSRTSGSVYYTVR